MSEEDGELEIGPPPTPELVGETLDRAVDALSSLVIAAKTGGDAVKASQDISDVTDILTQTIILPIAFTQLELQEDLTNLLSLIAEAIVGLVNDYGEYSNDRRNRALLAQFEQSARKVGDTMLSLSNIVDVSFKKQEIAHLSVEERLVEEQRFLDEQRAEQAAYQSGIVQQVNEPIAGRAEILTPSQVVATQKIAEANLEFASVADELVTLAGSAVQEISSPGQRVALVAAIDRTENASTSVKQDPSNPTKQVALTLCVKDLAHTVQQTDVYQKNQELTEALKAVEVHANTVVEDLTAKGLIVIESASKEEAAAYTSQAQAVSASTAETPKVAAISTPSLPDVSTITISTPSSSTTFATTTTTTATPVKSATPEQPSIMVVRRISVAKTEPSPDVPFAQAPATPSVVAHRAVALKEIVRTVIQTDVVLTPAERVEKTKEMSKDMQVLSRKMTEMATQVKDDKTRKQLVTQSKLIQDRALQLKIIMSVKAAGSDDDPASDSQVKAAAALLEQAVGSVQSEMRSLDLQHQLQSTVTQVVAVKKAVNAFKRHKK
eukprot:TRINITY_DN129_c1_g1_i1.p1 TRINITY_DN129_c1_g1~~TRINITY_DN129_c1_g1_i1.p1  ORF type:complete len:551 (-),score=159.39 TRINITY_DN129_c1_g1_i1:120-1772(-)